MVCCYKLFLLIYLSGFLFSAYAYLDKSLLNLLHINLFLAVARRKERSLIEQILQIRAGKTGSCLCHNS